MTIRGRTLWLGSLLLCCIAAAHGRTEKWIGADGRTYYGDRPPDALVKSEKLKGGTVSAADHTQAPSSNQNTSERRVFVGGKGAATPSSKPASAATPRGTWHCD